MEPIAGPSNSNALIKYVQSRSGKKVLLYDNNTYRPIKVNKNGNTLWRCTIKTCGAFLTLNRYEDILKKNENSCWRNEASQFVREVVDDIHQEAMSTLDPLPEVYKRKLNDLLDQGINLTREIPKFENIKTGLYNKRNKSLGVKRLFGKSPKDVPCLSHMYVATLTTMCSKTLLVFFVVYFLSNFAYGQRDIKFFREDYSYLETTEGFYKIHTSRQTWAEAKRVCALEGASFFYPDNRDEANAVISLWKSIQPNVPWAFVGLSDIISEGVFETVDGKSVSEVYNQWQQGEPNDLGGNEDCVHLNLRGNINDFRCDGKSYFICKKSLLSLEWNYHCNMSNLDYTFDEDIGKCYKLHSTPLNWMEAHAVCRAEQSYLAVINNQLEADYLANFTESTSNQRVGGDYFRGIYHMGFHNRLHEGWQTVRGTPMTVDDSTWWDNHQPNGDDREHCGSMFYTGRLNIVNCDTKSFFICEHDVGSPILALEEIQ